MRQSEGTMEVLDRILKHDRLCMDVTGSITPDLLYTKGKLLKNHKEVVAVGASATCKWLNDRIDYLNSNV